MNSKLPKINIRRKEFLWSMVIGLLMLFVSYEAMNVYWPWTGGEKIKLQTCEWIRQHLRNRNFDDDMLDSVMMVDVHYDKVFALEYNNDLLKGKVAVTDHKKLLTFLQKLKQYDNYKYIILDLYIEKALPQDIDEELINTITSMNRIVVPIPLNGLDNMDGKLLSRAAMAKYGSTLWESDFVKYPYYSEGIKSIPLKMYEDLTGRSISNNYLFVWDKGLARRNVMLTYEFRESEYPYLLGQGILGDSLAGEKTTGIIDKPEKFKDKYILIGDLEEDRHETFIGEMSGTAINFNAFISLLHGKHRPGFLMLLSMYVVFTLLAYLTLTRNRLIFGGFFGYAAYLLFFCIAIYICCNEVYEILILSAIYALIKMCVEHNWFKSK
ncbi:MAG: CHASE2 domain-containing protein [Prevotella sp.]|nr:CHASE2 domain-containing protein [Prevotella sp.]